MGATSDGTLYIQNTATAGQSGQLYTIDPNTAKITLVGNTDFASSCGLSGDTSGNLYDGQGTQGGGFYRLDRISGQGTLVGNPNYGQLSGFGQVYSLAFANSTMYAISYSGPIYAVNLLDGSSTQISSYNASLIGGAWSATAELAAAPEASSLTIGLLAAGMLGVVRLRRRSQEGHSSV
jgi:hypothetical protein